MLKDQKKNAECYYKPSPSSLVMRECSKQDRVMRGTHYTDTQWLSLLTEHLGTISYILHNREEIDFDVASELEASLVKLSAFSMTWLEEIRKDDKM